MNRNRGRGFGDDIFDNDTYTQDLFGESLKVELNLNVKQKSAKRTIKENINLVKNFLGATYIKMFGGNYAYFDCRR